MSMTTRVKNVLMNNITTAFKAISSDGSTVTPIEGTKMPKQKGAKLSNKAPIAWEYFIAHHLSALAKARLEEAKKAAIITGVIFDHDKYPRAVGTFDEIYKDDYVVVTLDVRNGSLRVNADIMCENLIKKGVDAKIVADAYAAASVKTRPPHSFKPSLVTDEPSGK